MASVLMEPYKVQIELVLTLICVVLTSATLGFPWAPVKVAVIA